MLRKVAIVTWVKYYNFGTFLQAYSLQSIITKLGYESYILDDTSIREIEQIGNEQSTLYRMLSYFRKELVMLLNYGVKDYILFKKSDTMYIQFRNHYLQIDKKINPLSDLDNRYDIFVCGSDQIWYPSVNIYSPYYYLSFTNKKKVAYAPSIGTVNYPKSFIKNIKPLLDQFNYLSVREKAGANIINSITSRTVEVVLDPTLLLNSNEWDNLLLPNPICKGEYIFCYFLTFNERYVRFVMDYSKRMSLPVLVFALSQNICMKILGDKVIAGGPKEFLTAIKGASYIFTDSFHGTIFAIQFQKRFITFKRFKETDSMNQNSRLDNLFTMLELNNCFIGEENLSEISSIVDVDYARVHTILDNERKKSLSFLQNALEN